MPPIISLEQLRDYAAAHPDTEYDLDDGTRCLAAQAAGRPMYDWYSFADVSGEKVYLPGLYWDNEATVPQTFAELTRAVSRLGVKVVRGTRLKNALDALIAGESPLTATRHIVA